MHHIDRREWVGRVLSALMIAKPCCVTEELPAGAAVVTDKLLRVDLKKAGRTARKDGAFQFVDTPRGINLIVVHSRDGRYAALGRSCTHGGAQVVFNQYNQTVQCTSWGHSEFALDGRVLGGSAKKPLPMFETRRTGNWLEISL